MIRVAVVFSLGVLFAPFWAKASVSTGGCPLGCGPPEAGRYMAKILVSKVDGAECPDRQGNVYDGVVQYPGFGGSRVTIRIPVVSDGPALDREVLTITSGTGTKRPRGDFSARFTSPINMRITGEFEAKLTLIGAEEFTATITEMSSKIDCTEVLRIALVRSG
jgi:hypothetical protein